MNDEKFDVVGTREMSRLRAFGDAWYDIHDNGPKEITAVKVAETASWRGGHPVVEGQQALDELVVALGVPDESRMGFQPIRVYDPEDQQSPQVTHWMWRD